MAESISLDDTSRCPVASTCASCGGMDELAVATFDTHVGVYCATVCTPCIDAARYPKPAGWSGAIEAVFAHCGHLGIDADQAAELRERDHG